MPEDPRTAPLPWTLDTPAHGLVQVLDATGSPVYAGPDVEDLLARVEDLTGVRPAPAGVTP